MKKFLYTIIAAAGLFVASSCQDMLETESSNMLTEPSLSQKTDSVFYAYGIMQAMQQLADQYFFQNEMRGELVTTTKYATTDLRNLSNFDADASNKYDSVYLYYKVINNCNYYLKHRKTDLVTGSTYVVMNEYIAIASLRAWAYLQMVRQYGDVPYITEPVTSVSQINANQQKVAASAILASEAEYLESLKRQWPSEYWEVPTYGKSDLEIGGNGARSKRFSPSKCFVPLNVILGELYLEDGQYEKAAQAYCDYLYYNQLPDKFKKNNVNFAQVVSRKFDGIFTLPSNYDNITMDALYENASSWVSIFGTGSEPGDVITYIPMAASALNGQTTDVPEAFGYSYYNSSDGKRIARVAANSEEISELQVLPTKDFQNTYTHVPFYYVRTRTATEASSKTYVESVDLGDARFNFVSNGTDVDSLNVYVYKPSNGNIYLYRTSMVLLHLAEALNRMECPDAAFAILKTGLAASSTGGLTRFLESNYVEGGTYPQKAYFLTKATAEKLAKLNILPAFNEDGSWDASTDGSLLFPNSSCAMYSIGIHAHGAGYIKGLESTYYLSDVLQAKYEELKAKFGERVKLETKEDSIEIMEDILCDEYALELAFEGCRFGDLQRLARHKNESGKFGGGFGDLWLTEKLKGKGKNISLQNCYLPFK